MHDLVEYMVKCIRLSEGIERGVGLEPLIQEFVDEVESLGPDVRANRIEKITAYYNSILKKSGQVTTAYRATRQWAIGAFIQHQIQKRREDYGLDK